MATKTRHVWTVPALERAVAEAIGDDVAAVMWADADGNAVSRRSWNGRPPQLVAAAVLYADDAGLRELPGFVRLVARDDEDIDGEACRVVRAVFARVAS